MMLHQILYLHTLIFMLLFNAKELLLFYVMLAYTKLQYYTLRKHRIHIEYAYYTKKPQNPYTDPPNRYIDITNEITALYTFNSKVTIGKMISWLHYFDKDITTVQLKYKCGNKYMISHIDLINRRELNTNSDIVAGCLNLDKLPYVCVSNEISP